MRHIALIALFILTSASAFASGPRVGQKVLVDYGYSTTLEEVTDVNADSLVRTTVAYGDDYLKVSQVHPYHPAKTLTVRTWTDYLMRRPGTTYRIGQEVMVHRGYSITKETITDLTTDGRIRTTFGYGTDYTDSSVISPYQPASN